MLASVISFYLLHINLIDRNYHWGRSYLVFLGFFFLSFFFNGIRPAVFSFPYLHFQTPFFSFKNSRKSLWLFRVLLAYEGYEGETKGKWKNCLFYGYAYVLLLFIFFYLFILEKGRASWFFLGAQHIHSGFGSVRGFEKGGRGDTGK